MSRAPASVTIGYEISPEGARRLDDELGYRKLRSYLGIHIYASPAGGDFHVWAQAKNTSDEAELRDMLIYVLFCLATK